VSVLNVSKIRSLRKQKGWEQKDLAASAKINPAVISRLERGNQNDFKISVIVSIAAALSVPIDNLLQEEYQFSPPTLSPELQSAISHLNTHPTHVQNRIAGMIEGYLSALEKEQ